MGRQPCWVACLSMCLCSYLAESTLWKSALLVSLLRVQDFTKTSFSNLRVIEQMELYFIWSLLKSMHLVQYILYT
jgi:hypothetical protein